MEKNMIKFKKVYVEITNECNLNCSFCHKTKRPIEYMTPEFFEHIINEIKPYTGYIYMHIMGEPLLHNKIDELLDICGENGIKANITTNGTLINKMTHKILNKKALRQVNFSLHSFDDNDKFNMGVENSQYLKNIIEFINLSAPQGIINCLRLWNLDKNSTDDKNNEVLDYLKNEFQLKDNIQCGVTDRNGLKLSDKIYLQQTNEFTWPDIEGDDVFLKGRCLGLKTHVGILADGSVIPCCLDCEGDMTLGNIKEKKFDEIVQNKRAVNILEGFRCEKPVEKLCRTCGWNLYI